MKVRTRFAPSPTGHVHIGNMRVAIYNWLFARNQGGSFLLRVEDTDRERSTPEAIETLLNAMEWLGLDVDEEPLYQSHRMDLHLAEADALIERGLAYRAEKGGPGSGECILFRMPNHAISFQDLIKGRPTKAAENMEDFVIVRSNGTPVFHLANVLDDIEQGITHVIRGDDHIENTYRHIALYEALGAPVPTFAHLPMIVNAQGKPYSKRDGDAFVGDFQANGFLGDALFNYLALLGWSPGDDREIMTRAEMVEAFELERCQSSAAQVDLKKLIWMNYEYIMRVSELDFRAASEAALKQADIIFSQSQLDAVLPLIRERVKTYSEIAPLSRFLFVDDYEYDEKALKKKLIKEGVPETLAMLRQLLLEIDPFEAAPLECLLHDYVEQSGKGFGEVMPPLRVCISGEQGGPDLCLVLEVLGRKEVIRRLDRAVAKFFRN
ncbi:MAG TPA: glutamate--tRNA ligase [Verrucomicrobia bacterium]|nr:glutamate--tRNA ligase [Verrucomicrobiota bacterium]|tara:strand:- start:2103 stop:3413 length:1311 start_codon:yes stop_codon:yes gene_type:complete